MSESNQIKSEVDQAIADMWNACDHDDGVEISAWHDQWWGVTAKCGHLTAHGVSNGIVDLSTAFDRCRIDFLGQHKALPVPPTRRSLEEIAEWYESHDAITSEPIEESHD